MAGIGSGVWFTGGFGEFQRRTIADEILMLPLCFFMVATIYGFDKCFFTRYGMLCIYRKKDVDRAGKEWVV